MEQGTYKAMRSRLDDRKNVGHDYEGSIMRSSINDNILKNPKAAEIVEKIEDALMAWIRGIKGIKASRNPYIDKDETRFN